MLVEDFADGLRAGIGAPERATLVTGLRGTGKTVMLNAYEDAARRLGWLVVSEDSTPGLVGRLVHTHLPALLRDHAERTTSSKVTGGELGRHERVPPN